jgi:hypothetical protein
LTKSNRAPSQHKPHERHRSSAESTVPKIELPPPDSNSGFGGRNFLGAYDQVQALLSIYPDLLPATPCPFQGRRDEEYIFPVFPSQREKMAGWTGLEPALQLEVKSLENADLVEVQFLENGDKKQDDETKRS